MPADTARLIRSKIEPCAQDPASQGNNVKSLEGREWIRLRVSEAGTGSAAVSASLPRMLMCSFRPARTPWRQVIVGTVQPGQAEMAAKIAMPAATPAPTTRNRVRRLRSCRDTAPAA
jgi:hypothetical protein